MANKLKRGKGESHKRTIVKTISWRIVATLTTITIVFFFTRQLFLSLGVGFFEVVSKISFYYLHERAWGKISWGKEKHPLASIPVNRELEPDDMEKIKRQLKDLGYLD